MGGSNLEQSPGEERAAQKRFGDGGRGWIVRTLTVIMDAPTGKATLAGGKKPLKIFSFSKRCRKRGVLRDAGVNIHRRFIEIALFL